MVTIDLADYESLNIRPVFETYENDIKVREDSDLADMLASLELDSPVPTEALMAIAEILSYVYRANGEVDPFNALLEDLNDPNSPLT